MPLHPQAKAELEFLRSLGVPENNTQTPQQARQGHVDRRPKDPPAPEPVHFVEDREIPGPAGDLKVRVYRPSDADGLPMLLGIHGGGWVLGDVITEDGSMRGLVNGAQCVAVSVEYRLAPESRFPEPLDDCYAALEWMAEHAGELGGDASRLAVAGTSAGGNLSAAVALKARDESGPGLSHQVLFTPVIDHDFTTESYKTRGEGYFLTQDSMEWFWHNYIGPNGDPYHPLASVLRATDLSGLPATTIVTAEYDPLRDEGEAYGVALAEAGVDVECTRYDGMIHGFNLQPGKFDDGRKALSEASARLRSSFGSANS
ncbi:MAG: alpha/beta hydrolase [Chloroflexi bacterium]|nr:alpha/beta hydrolase [Chloroflexota bacterium]